MSRIAPVLAAPLLVFALTGCSSGSSSLVSGSDAERDTASAEDTQVENAEALLAYVEAERATIPQILDQFPGLYSEVIINGSLEESRGDRGLPAGVFSVVFYEYTYAQEMDWSTTMDALDAERSSIDDLCRTTLFPAMRNAGVIGPLSVVYSYGDGRSQFGAMWHHTCSEY